MHTQAPGTRRSPLASTHASPDRSPADVLVLGGGIVGLLTALQYDRRGVRVILLDETNAKQRHSYKVGESLLVYANAFLRTVGDLDEELTASRPKGGFWMARGMEGRAEFSDDVCEWGFQSKLPQRWLDAIEDQSFARTMFGDVQICRPEIEAALRDRVRASGGVTEVVGRARSIELGEDQGDHEVGWAARDGGSGRIRARWVVDCTGQARFLARTLGLDDTPPRAFRNSSAWAQFAGCVDDHFGAQWQFEFPDGERVRRDEDTVHLWGDGYWIWIIKLSQQRVSVGVSWDRDRVWTDSGARDVFWEAVRRYPLLDWLRAEDLLEFGAYKQAQHYTTTVVSPRRFAVHGDAGTIVDAYYSQGISLSLQQSWHVANLVEDDVLHGRLDLDYLHRVDAAALADWRIVASMVRNKYGPALADSRFFVLDHLLDYTVFGGALLGRYRISRWLSETGGRPADETEWHRELRRGLRRRLFLSQSLPWNRLDPSRVADLVERWRDVLQRNAIWRLEHGVHPAPMKVGLRAQAALPGLWRLRRADAGRSVDLTVGEIREPAFMRLKGTESRPPALAGSGVMLLIFSSCGLIHDVLDTSVRRFRHRWSPRRSSSGAAQEAVASPDSPGAVGAGRAA